MKRLTSRMPSGLAAALTLLLAASAADAKPKIMILATGGTIAGVGDGNSTDAAIAVLADAAKKGVAVVRATRTGSGLVVRTVEVDDDALGFIATMELNPQEARILLMLGLMKTQDPKALQTLFMEY